MGVGGASASVQSVGSGGARGPGGPERRRGGGPERGRRRIAAVRVGSGVASATTASVGVEARRRARDEGVGGASAAVQRRPRRGGGAQSVGSGNASAPVRDVGSGGASAQTASVGVGRAAPAMASVGAGRRAFAEVSSGSDDDDDDRGPGAAPARGHHGDLHGPAAAAAAHAAAGTRDRQRRQQHAARLGPRGRVGRRQRQRRRRRASRRCSEGTRPVAAPCLRPGSTTSRRRTPRPGAASPPRPTTTKRTSPCTRGGPCRRAAARGRPRGAPARRPGTSSPPPQRSRRTTGAARPTSRRASASSPALRRSPDRKQGSADLQARLRKLPGSPAGRPAHKRGSANLQARLRKLQAAAHKVGARPAAARSPTRPSPRAVEERAAYVAAEARRRAAVRSFGVCSFEVPSRAAPWSSHGAAIGDAQVRRRGRARPGAAAPGPAQQDRAPRRTSIFTAALELKKLRAQGGALHYRVWDPQSGVDTSWPKKYTGPFDYVPGSGSKPHTKPAPVPRFRWRQRADDEGLPYYVDAATGDTVRAAPEAWVAFTRQRGDNLPTGVVRRVGSICEYLDEKSGRVYYHDSETSSTNWARPSAFADEEDRAHAVAPRSPNRLGGLRNACAGARTFWPSWSASRGLRSSSCRPRSGTSLK